MENPLDHMPVVTYQAQDLWPILGKEIPAAELAERMPMMGGDLDGLDGDEITIEWFPDRPDLLMAETCALALGAFLGDKQGRFETEVAKPQTTLTVDPAVQSVRPYAALCFVRGLQLDERAVELLIQAQEKLCISMGRKRRKIAIGMHDARDVQGPFQYTILGADAEAFVPLQETHAMTPGEILKQHPKGQEYGHLVPENQIPAFLDGQGKVLSLPPIINAAATAVTSETQDILLDVTGDNIMAVKQTIALLALGLAARGGTIEAVRIEDASGHWNCPDLEPREIVLKVQDVQSLLGLPLEDEDIALALQKMGHEAEGYGDKVLVHSPAYRFDLLHEVDWMEDVAIGYGFENFPGSLPRTLTFGGTLDHQETEDRLRNLLVGHGMLEVRTLTLTNMEDAYTKWGAEVEEDQHVRVANPVLEEQTHLRRVLAPSLLKVLARNVHRPLPQRVFELGYVVEPLEDAYRNQLHMACVETGAKQGFTDALALVRALGRDLRLELNLVETHDPGTIAGRCATIACDGVTLGRVFELHPDTLLAFELVAATTVTEWNVSKLTEILDGRS